MVTIFLRNWKPNSHKDINTTKGDIDCLSHNSVSSLSHNSKNNKKLKRNMHRCKSFPKNVKGSFIRELSKNSNGKYTGIDTGLDV